MKTFSTNVFLAALWLALTMKFTIINGLFGFVLGYFVLWFLKRKDKKEKYFKRVPSFASFMFLFGKEVIKGSIRIGYEIISPKHYMNPGIIAIPLTAKTEMEITLLANSITLTPGTTSLALSDDRKVLYVYTVFLHKNPEKTIQSIKNGLERKLLEVMR